MMELFPTIYSTLSPDALADQVEAAYDIKAPEDCLLLKRGWNDTYLLRTRTDRYIVRVYRSEWRDEPTISFEIDLLDHLAAAGASVATAVRSREGHHLLHLIAAEGERVAVLFEHAPGAIPDIGDPTLMHEFGALSARVHAASDRFLSPYTRPRMTSEYLLDRPLRAIAPFLQHRPAEWRYVQQLAERLREFVNDAALEDLDFGLCHGDLHSGNAHVSDGRLMLFDFDFCAYGWRAYDVASFACIARTKRAKESWHAYLDGYRTNRPFSNTNLTAMHYFMPIRYIWLIGIHAENSREAGSGWLSDDYLDSWLRILHDCERVIDATVLRTHPEDIFEVVDRTPRDLWMRSRRRLRKLVSAYM